MCSTAGYYEQEKNNQEKGMLHKLNFNNTGLSIRAVFN
uniref:Uncharacterized protein n=1 Tax=uncultured bacterium BLR12 TaxID=506514 RepID=C0IND0_9BACT|nr:hypothetical protein AKSOIL_0201 [uncultured bacterium BLR12]